LDKIFEDFSNRSAGNLEQATKRSIHFLDQENPLETADANYARLRERRGANSPKKAKKDGRPNGLDDHQLHRCGTSYPEGTLIQRVRSRSTVIPRANVHFGRQSSSFGSLVPDALS
jgi:hypothetical protein